MGALEVLEPEDPRQVGRYKMVARLGAGGMGQVYLARSPGGRPVAVKVVRPELARDGEFRRRFAREVVAARRVNGAFTAGVVDAAPDGSPPWLATVYVPGVPLGEAIARQGSWPVQSVLALGAGLVEALEAIHAAGVIHRDLKPSNVLLATDGPRVIDFGISIASEASALTSTGMTIGTPGFMSPEQLTGRPVGAASDIFALGSVLAYTATGVGPFGTGTPHALHFRAVYEQPNLDALPPELRHVVAACLAKQPDQRPTVATLLDQLTTAAGDESGETAAATLLLTEPGWMPDHIIQLIREHTSALPHTPLPLPPERHPALPAADPPTPDEQAPGPPKTSLPQTTETLPPAPPAPPNAQTPASEAQQEPTTVDGQSTPLPLPASDLSQSGSAEQPPGPTPASQGHPSGHQSHISRRRALFALTGTTVAAATALTTWKIRDNGSGGPEGSRDSTGKKRSREPAENGSSFTPGKQIWSFLTGSYVHSSPAVAKGVVYVGSWDRKLYAVDADSGIGVWSYPTPLGGVSSSPAVVNDIVYFGCEDGDLRAVDAETGKLIWRFTADDVMRSSPTVANGIVYIGSDDENLYAVRADSGEKVWSFSTGDEVRSSPAVANGIVYVGSRDNELCAVGADSGKKIWAFPTENAVTSSPVVADGIVYVGSDGKNLYAVDASSGKKVWSFPAGDPVTSGPTVVNGIVYFGSYDKNLYAVDASSGKKVWSFPTGDPVTSAPAVAKGVVYFGSYDKNLYAVDASSGKKVWAFPTGDQVTSGPTVVNGIVYFGSTDNNLYAVQT
ncbi:PQQ-binding-like beta-propeller repeat protein [Streptomyces sp. NPDC057474]|uniref:outer membrane protein assembly factor BamB family protein n=1 Tax=Streptomyces sp. NPDC057474 TaxID=3346144 RepID=UPI003696A6C1